jgi:hypothetical protein
MKRTRDDSQQRRIYFALLQGWQGFRCMTRTRGNSQQRELPITLIRRLPGVQVYEGDYE